MHGDAYQNPSIKILRLAIKKNMILDLNLLVHLKIVNMIIVQYYNNMQENIILS